LRREVSKYTRLVSGEGLEGSNAITVAISGYRDLGFILFIIALTMLVIKNSALTALTIVPKAGAALVGLAITAIVRPIIIAFQAIEKLIAK